jgi:hemolysin III
MSLPAPVKPKLRGVSHGIGFFVALGAGIYLSLQVAAELKIWCALYSLALCLMLGASALYHLPEWTATQRQWMRRLDHCGIFLLIAGTGTPFSQVLNADSQRPYLTVLWVGAFIGCARALFWITAPKWLVAILAVGVGWAVIPFIPQLQEALGPQTLSLIVYGGALYTLGAATYALKWPTISAKYFGYHEVFHLFVLLAAGVHFAAVYRGMLQLR